MRLSSDSPPWSSSSLHRRPADPVFTLTGANKGLLTPITGVDSLTCNELRLISRCTPGCAIPVLVERSWIVVHRGDIQRQSGPHRCCRWGRPSLNLLNTAFFESFSPLNPNLWPPWTRCIYAATDTPGYSGSSKSVTATTLCPTLSACSPK